MIRVDVGVQEVLKLRIFAVSFCPAANVHWAGRTLSIWSINPITCTTEQRPEILTLLLFSVFCWKNRLKLRFLVIGASSLQQEVTRPLNTTDAVYLQTLFGTFMMNKNTLTFTETFLFSVFSRGRWSWSFSLALHKDWKQGETASLAPPPNSSMCVWWTCLMFIDQVEKQKCKRDVEVLLELLTRNKRIL